VPWLLLKLRGALQISKRWDFFGTKGRPGAGGEEMSAIGSNLRGDMPRSSERRPAASHICEQKGTWAAVPPLHHRPMPLRAGLPLLIFFAACEPLSLGSNGTTGLRDRSRNAFL
jgi:hypothetical protein